MTDINKEFEKKWRDILGRDIHPLAHHLVAGAKKVTELDSPVEFIWELSQKGLSFAVAIEALQDNRTRVTFPTLAINIDSDSQSVLTEFRTDTGVQTKWYESDETPPEPNLTSPFCILVASINAHGIDVQYIFSRT